MERPPGVVHSGGCFCVCLAEVTQRVPASLFQGDGAARVSTAKLRMNAFTFQAFVTKFIHTPRPQSWLDKPIYLLKKLFRPLGIRAPFRYSRKRQ